jgi:hypothetical protein
MPQPPTIEEEGIGIMNRLVVVILILALWSAAMPRGHAEWGWPPPGYSVTGVRACDGYHYRGLRQVLRDRRNGSHCCDQSPQPVPGPSASGMPAATPSQPEALPQPAPAKK